MSLSNVSHGVHTLLALVLLSVGAHAFAQEAAPQALNVVIIDAGFAEQMQAQFATDLTTASPIVLSEWKHRPFGDRVKQRFWVMWERFL